MKCTKIILSLAFLTATLIAQNLVAQPGETGQRMRISQGRTVLGTYGVAGTAAESGISTPIPLTTATALTFESLDATTPSVGNVLCRGVNDGNCGWYKAFWIFGDGNYIKFRDDISTLDAASKTIVGYRYFQPGRYNPVVYLTEKYHNSKPPEEARSSINVSGAGASGTPIEPTVRLVARPDAKVDIDYNHTPRAGYPINFVLSYRLSEPATTALFYYNSLSNIGFGSFAPTSLLKYKATELTAYQNTAFTPQVVENLATGGVPPFVFGGPSLLDAMNTKFKSRLLFNTAAPIGLFTEGVTELRVFPVLETFKMANLPDGALPPATSPACFACILVGPDSVSSSDPAHGRMLKLAQTLFGNNFTGSFRLGPNSQIYIKGIELLNLTLDASHDPNGLVVTDIRDLGTGKFRVSFRMLVCNTGSGNETNPTLTFNDITGGHYVAQPQFIDLSGTAPVWTGGTPGLSWSANLPGFQITGVPPEYEPSCRELYFTLETDAAGVARLYDESPRAVEVCVKFSAGEGACSPNDMLSSQQFQKEDGTYPGIGEARPGDGPNPVPTPTNSCGLLCILLILVIVGILIWYFFKQQND